MSTGEAPRARAPVRPVAPYTRMSMGSKPSLLRLSLAALSLLVTLGSHPAPARAQDEAAAAFSEGLRLFAAEDYPGARAAFERAYQAQPNVRVLANIADCLAREGKIAAAVMTYRKFLAEAGDEIPGPARRLVERRTADLRAQVSDLSVTVEPAGATVLVDGEEIGTAPLPEAFAIDAGEHRVEARLPGHESVARTVQANAGGDLVVALTLPETRAEPGPVEPIESPVEPPPPPQPQPAATPLGRGPLLWVGAGLTAALAITGTITGVMALSSRSEYEDAGTSLERRRELYDSRKTLPLVTDVLLDGAIVVGLATTALYLFAGPRAPAEESGADADLALRIPSGGGLACDLRTSF